MNITKCDVCKKESEEYLFVGTAPFHGMEFCYDCGKPALRLLRKYKSDLLPEKYEKGKK